MFPSKSISGLRPLQKNLPDSAAAYTYLPNPFSPVQSPAARDAAAPFSSIPTSASFHYRSTNPTSPPSATFRPPISERKSIDSTASMKSLRDAERELAELRLAMVGMGKAMSEWLTILPALSEPTAAHVSATRGLERIRDTLLDSAGKDVDDIVKEWVWHEGLKAARSRGPTPISTSGPGPGDQSTIQPVSDELVSDAGEVTPTFPSFPAMPFTPTMPFSLTFSHSAPLQSHASESRPPLHLSTRDDKPIASLPRAPMTAPLHATKSTSSFQGRANGIQADNHGATGSTRVDQEGEVQPAKSNGDPLAGMGVSTEKANGSRRAGPHGGGGGVDPLLGVGVR